MNIHDLRKHPPSNNQQKYGQKPCSISVDAAVCSNTYRCSIGGSSLDAEQGRERRLLEGTPSSHLIAKNLSYAGLESL